MTVGAKVYCKPLKLRHPELGSGSNAGSEPQMLLKQVQHDGMTAAVLFLRL